MHEIKGIFLFENLFGKTVFFNCPSFAYFAFGMKKAFAFILFIFSTFIFQATAQKGLFPKATFDKDSAKIGEKVKLSVYLDYPYTNKILFPDTNYDFQPFEILKRDFFPTRTRNNISRDCVVFEVCTFLPDSIQKIQVPIFQFQEKDSLSWYSNEASIFITPVIKGPVPEKPVFETALSPVPVARKINYPYIIIGMSVIIILILIINFFFDRPIQKFIYLFLEARRHKAYLKQFEKINGQLENSLTVELVENLLVTWKKYLQRVDDHPYTSFTSREIYQVLPDQVLRDALMEIDRWIYGGLDMKDWRSNFNYLKNISLQFYQKKREAIRNGKFE